MTAVLSSTSNVNNGVQFSASHLLQNGIQLVANGGSNFVENGIHDSSQGKTCHQCRQKTKNICAKCKNVKNGKPCPIKLCYKCLLNRYGENAKEVELLPHWNCPKCRGICNCSCCLKKQGKQPTGAITREARDLGFNSVSEMLNGRASKQDSKANNASNEGTEKKDHVELPFKKPKEKESFDRSSGLRVAPLRFVSPERSRKTRHEEVKEDEETRGDANGGMEEVPNEVSKKETNVEGRSEDRPFGSETNVDNGHEEEIHVPLPSGTEITEILEVEFPPENVGDALQFLEFCRVFGKALDVKKGEAEAILRELVRKKSLRRGTNTLLVQFQIKLLNVILNDSGNDSPSLTTSDGDDSWFKALEKLMTQSQSVLKIFSLDERISRYYYDLDLSKKLRLLNFLCDEALATGKLRSSIEEQNARHVAKVKDAKAKVAVAREKEWDLKKSLHEKMSKAVFKTMGPLTKKDHDAIEKIRTEAAKAHAEMLEAAKGTVPKRKKRSDAMRPELEHLDSSGQAFWKLKCFEGEEDNILMQEIKINEETGAASEEKWFLYGPEKKDEVEKYISTRSKRTKRQESAALRSNESMGPKNI